MKWHTTTEAAELLKVSPSRVRQLVAKFKGNQALVKRYEGRNYISDTLIKQHLESVSKSVSTNESLSLEDYEEGVHFADNGNVVEVFSPDKFEQFRKELIEARQLTLALEQERSRRKFAEKQLEAQNHILNNSLIAIQKSLDNVEESLLNTKRQQIIDFKKIEGN